MSAKVPSRMIYALCGAAIALAAAESYLASNLHHTRLDTARTEQSIAAGIAQVRDTTLAGTQASSLEVSTLRDALSSARIQAALSASQAKHEAQRCAEALAQAIAAKRRKHAAQVRAELNNIRAVSVAAKIALGDIDNELQQTAAEVSAADGGLDAANTDIDSARADLAGMRSLIATSAGRLADLKALAEKTYIEFEIEKGQPAREIAGVALALTSVDEAVSRFTLELVSGGVRQERRDHAINEPVLFYISGVPQAYELVVNRIEKDRVSGYIAAPKAALATGD